MPYKNDMVDAIYLYISAAIDLERERDLLSRAMVEIPVTLGWRIIQTPLHGEPLDMEAVAQADLHLLLIGGDIRAPIGQEWWIARRARRSPVLFIKKDAPRTPAAQAFVRHLSEYAVWHPFNNGTDLHRQILLFMSGYFQDHAEYYALSPTELERLKAWQAELEKAAPMNIEETRRAAADNSVVFSAERYIPSEGVLLKGKPVRSTR